MRISTSRPQPRPRRTALTGWRIALAILAWWAIPTARSQPAAWPDYEAWTAACRKLPANRVLGDRLPPRSVLPLKSFGEFKSVLGAFLDLNRTGALAQAQAWVGAPPPADPFFNLESGYYLRPGIPFLPFAQRLTVPAGTRLFFHGDLHGDIRSLLAFLDALNREGHLAGFRVARPEVRLVFLGDYTDRGRYGIEVMYTLMRLKLANPGQVFLVRGNHEDVSLVARYGFLAEASAKFGGEFEPREVVRLYDFLPAVLYLSCGTNVVQCNHGGLEPGYRPTRLLAAPEGVAFQLLGALGQQRWLRSRTGEVSGLPLAERRALESNLSDFIPESPTTPTVLGFMWNDFTVVAGEPEFAIDPGRAFVYGSTLTRLMLEDASPPTHRVRAVFRGHQHAAALNPLMRRLIASRGIVRHWQNEDRKELLEAAPGALSRVLETAEERALPEGSVWTFNVSPDSVYGAGCGFGFSSFGELVPAQRWEDWRIRVRNLEVVTER